MDRVSEQRHGDAQDVLAACNGSAEAFERLARAWATRVAALARAMVGAADAEDLTQETLLKAWQALPSLKDPARFGAWLFTIARNLGRNRLRTLARRGSTLALDDEPVAPPEVVVDENDRLRQAVAGLSATQREVVRLRYEAGMSYREIAAALGIPEKRVKSRLYDAKSLLRKALG